MLDRLVQIDADYRALEESLASQEVLSDQAKLRDASRRYKQQTPLVLCIREYLDTEGNTEAARELLADADGSEREQLQAEIDAGVIKLSELEERLKVLLLPSDPNDGKNIIIEIRGAEGGEEANLFAGDLFEMYAAYAARQGWAWEVLSRDNSPMGGINQITVSAKGDTVWTRMRFEAGPHRVQRVPVTEAQGRIHTSSATVMVLPEAEEVDFELDMNDVRKDTFRASGAGGQHINKTESAIRLTHIPSGLVVECQDGRSQHKNLEHAMSVMRTRLFEQERQKQDSERSENRKQLVSSGDRSAKIRTYNFPQGRVTDHRIGFTSHALTTILAGDLTEVIEALHLAEKTELLKNI